MRCVKCRNNAGYNRAVVDVLSGTTIGGLCVNCEREEFGRSFQYTQGRADRKCQLCDRDGHVAVPQYVSRVESRNGDAVVRSSLEDCESAPCLCDEHFHEVLAADPPAPSVER